MKLVCNQVKTGTQRSCQRMQPICRWHQAAAPGDVEVTI